MPSPSVTRDGFKVLLRTCLELTDHDDLLVIYDESFHEFQSVFVDLLIDLGISAGLVFLPKSYQRSLIRKCDIPGQSSSIRIPSPIRAAINASTAILNVVDADNDTTLIRRAILHQPRTGGCRLAHIPGLSHEILATLVSSPIEQLIVDCEKLAWSLGEAAEAELRTRSSSGQEYRLRLPLGGWDIEPIMSPGVILPGSWGNVPPGETFCCPSPRGLSGSVCINGSVPGAVLRPEHEAILEFEDGRLMNCDGSTESPLVVLIENARRMGDPNWNAFAELGIGLNPGISALTGNSLFDEKVAGTVHVALGDNSVFGHPIASAWHADLVIQRPALYLDGRCVLESGSLCLPDDSERFSQITSLAESTFSDSTLVSVREAKISNDSGRLRRRVTSAYRVGHIRMADDELSTALAQAADALIRSRKVRIRDFLSQNPSFCNVPSGRLLTILEHYRVLLLGN